MMKNDIADHTFVDKFFQLEVYLPEIEKSQLKTDFIDLLKKTDLHSQLKFISDVETSIYRQDNLFDDYISNHRGVKRLTNQLVFDFNSLPDELNTNDFLNFTYLKMAFPFAIKFLNRNWSRIIPYNPDTNLCEPVEASDSDDFSIGITRDIRTYFFNSELNIEYDKYEISKGITEPKQLSESNNLSMQQNLLLSKTLIVLFGKHSVTESHTSIKFENKNIFNFENDFKNLKSLLEAGHCNDILNRIAYFNTQNKDEALKTIIILLYIFNEAENYGTYFNNVWNILSDFISRQLKQKRDNIDVWSEDRKSEIWAYINEEFLNKNYKLERKIEFLALISQHRIKLIFSDWGTTEDILKELSLTLYKELLTLKQDILWNIYDYSFYHAYHNVRKFQSRDTVNPITIEFWSKNDITLLCAQMTQNDALTSKMLQTSDYASQLFGSKNEYKNFINANLPNPITPALKEYIQFLELESFTKFSDYIRFDFSKFEFVNQKLQKIMESNNLKYDENNEIVEIVLKSNDREIGDITQTDMNSHYISGFLNLRKYQVDKICYTFIRLSTSTFHKEIPEIFEHYQRLLERKGQESTISSNKKYLTINDTIKSIEIISVQPSSYDSKIK